jgi:hypothetical protein
MPAVALTPAAIIGCILLAAGLKVGPAMPSAPTPKLALPQLPLPPGMSLPKLPSAPAMPALEQPKLVKLLTPFIDLGKGVAHGKIKCY